MLITHSAIRFSACVAFIRLLLESFVGLPKFIVHSFAQLLVCMFVLFLPVRKVCTYVLRHYQHQLTKNKNKTKYKNNNNKTRNSVITNLSLSLPACLPVSVSVCLSVCLQAGRQTDRERQRQIGYNIISGFVVVVVVLVFCCFYFLFVGVGSVFWGGFCFVFVCFLLSLKIINYQVDGSSYETNCFFLAKIPPRCTYKRYCYVHCLFVWNLSFCD